MADIKKEERWGRQLVLGTPWSLYAQRVKSLFGPDPDVTVEYQDDARFLLLRVKGSAKAAAISALLPSEMDYGSVILRIEVTQVFGDPGEDRKLFDDAFGGNPVFSGTAMGGIVGDIPYALFKPAVVQLHEDDVSKYEGLVTMTYEELARSVVEDTDVRICSDAIATSQSGGSAV